MYYLPTGEIIIRKRGSVVKIHPKLNTFEILEDT
jgi:ribosomal protein L27